MLTWGAVCCFGYLSGNNCMRFLLYIICLEWLQINLKNQHTLSVWIFLLMQIGFGFGCLNKLLGRAIY